MELLKVQDASLEPLRGKTVAVIGYGNQGRAQALNLRDSGIEVIVGNRDDSYRETAAADGFKPLEISNAADQGDIVLILTTDESQPHLWDAEISSGIRRGDTLVWASGYNVGYGLINPPPEADVVLVAPRMTGNMVRELFEHGRGAVAQFAVHQNATGQARQTALALCKGIGLTRGGVFESSFREEAELDLFAEQVVWAGLSAWFLECFEIGVENGFSPELMVLELYASGEAGEIMKHMATNGFFRQFANHSTTSQYGTLTRGQNLLNDEIRRKARQIFQEDVRQGAFVREWSDEQATGSKRLEELTAQALQHPMSRCEKAVIDAIQAAHSIPGNQ